jgi:Cu-Zn family superoxide dismutase
MRFREVVRKLHGCLQCQPSEHAKEKPMRMRLSLLLTAMSTAALADSASVDMHLITEQGIGHSIGTVQAQDSPHGLVLTPGLAGLPPGEHGFHVHAKPDCGPAETEGKSVAGLAAGGHFDPGETGRHEGPLGSGHLGDLPYLMVGADGKATTPVLVPRLKVADLKGHSLIIHAGGDNYADQPQKLGGGGARIACGVVP